MNPLIPILEYCFSRQRDRYHFINHNEITSVADRGFNIVTVEYRFRGRYHLGLTLSDLLWRPEERARSRAMESLKTVTIPEAAWKVADNWYRQHYLSPEERATMRAGK